MLSYLSRRAGGENGSVTGRYVSPLMLFLKRTPLLYLWIVVGIFYLQSFDTSYVEKANISTDKDGFWCLIAEGEDPGLPRFKDVPFDDSRGVQKVGSH